MPLRFVFDENQRGLLWRAAVRHNQAGVFPLDVVRVGDPTDLPLGSNDPDVLRWSEREDRILVSYDKTTILPFTLRSSVAISSKRDSMHSY
jgi:hypothetical protein